jgi:formylglycine-generating enzyme required for sulfatase activity
MLKKGHHNVKLDTEAWDRLVTWIDLNVPCYGAWSEAAGTRLSDTYIQRRKEMRKLYSNVDEDIETNNYKVSFDTTFVKPEAGPALNKTVPKIDKWPFEAKKGKSTKRIDLGNGKTLTMVKIPAGSFAMGSTTGSDDELPVTKVTISKPFWMCETEISLEHGYYDMHHKDQTKPGYLMDEPDLPAIRVSWNKADEFCKWLSKKTGKKVSLPTEAQWEWACRAGSDKQFFFGNIGDDFSKYMNCADLKTKELAVSGINPKPIKNPPPHLDYHPKDTRFNDGVLHLADVNKAAPNPWGLKHMHGNVAEWTRSTYTSYSGKTMSAGAPERVARGGSWHERPKYCTSSYRYSYPAWQQVYNVGFRVIIEE